VRDTHMLGRIVRWRIPGTPRNAAYRDIFGSYPFTVLDSGEGWMVSGLCGRIWTLRRDYPRIESPEEFRDWSQPGTVRVMFAHWVEPSDDGSVLLSDARVEAVDRRARLRLRALWATVGRFERLIGGEALRVAAERADRASA